MEVSVEITEEDIHGSNLPEATGFSHLGKQSFYPGIHLDYRLHHLQESQLHMRLWR